MSWSVVVVTEPAAETLTTAEAKAHLRVETSDEDALIGSYSSAWRRWLEEQTSRSFVKQTLDYFADDFPDGDDPIELPRSPLISATGVVHVKYTTTSATTAQTLSATAYSVDAKSEPPRIGLKTGQTWPTALLRDQNGVEVRFIAGMATSATGVALHPAKQFLRLAVGHSYSNREGVIVGSINTPLKFALDSFRSNLSVKRYM